MNSAIGVFDIIKIMNVFFVCLVIFFQRKNPTSTLVWVLAIYFLPIIGFILYMFLGQDMRKSRIFEMKAEEELELKKEIHRQKSILHSKEMTALSPMLSKYADNVNLLLNTAQSPIRSGNKIDLIIDGKDMYKKLYDSIDSAKQYIHVQYYIFNNDNLGKKFMKLLIKKASEGVKVKLIVDGFGCYKNTRKFYEPLLRAGGRVAVFFPTILPFFNLRINYRNHRKICIIDGTTGFVGGFNIGDEYMGKDKNLGYWRDTHVKIYGEAVQDMNFRFRLDWRYASGEGEVLEQEDVVEKPVFDKNKQGDSLVQIVSSGPDSKWRTVHSAIIKMINSSKDYVYIETPYLIPDDSLLQALKIAALSGIDVRIIVPSKPDHFWVFWAGNAYISELLESGVRVYYYQKGFIHSKAIVVDGNVSTVGTTNMDIRSFDLNFEINSFIYDKLLGAKMELVFINDLLDAEEIIYDEFAKRPIFHRFIESVAKLFSPLL